MSKKVTENLEDILYTNEGSKFFNLFLKKKVINWKFKEKNNQIIMWSKRRYWPSDPPKITKVPFLFLGTGRDSFVR